VSRVSRRSPDPETGTHRAPAQAWAATDDAVTYRAFVAWRGQRRLDAREKSESGGLALATERVRRPWSRSRAAGQQLLKQTNAICHEHRQRYRKSALPSLNPPLQDRGRRDEGKRSSRITGFLDASNRCATEAHVLDDCGLAQHTEWQLNAIDSTVGCAQIAVICRSRGGPLLAFTSPHGSGAQRSLDPLLRQLLSVFPTAHW
jgi:hypothetical protein